MKIKICISLVFLITGLSFATVPVQGAEPTEDMRQLARMFAALEAGDLKGYCSSMHTTSYADYLSRVCQSSVQHKLKQPEDCLPERIAQDAKTDAVQCLAMPAAEFDEIAQSVREGSKKFAAEMAAQGVDGEKLLREERVK